MALHDRDSVGSYHVRVRLQYEASLFPPLLSVVVLKHITQTLKHKRQLKTKSEQTEHSKCMSVKAFTKPEIDKGNY